MPLTPGESDRLLLHLEASLAQRRRERGLRLNVPEARALIADAVCEWARDGLGLVEARERAGQLLSVDDVLPGVPAALDEIRVEARFDDGTRLVVVKAPIADPSAETDSGGRYANSPEVPWPAPTSHVDIVNEASTAIGLTSHVHLAEVNPRLRLDRAAAFGMRPAIPTGETVWIRPGDSVRLGIRPITGRRILIGTSGVVEGALDDPAVRERALSVLRACGYLDVVDGLPVGDASTADGAVTALMAVRRGEANGG